MKRQRKVTRYNWKATSALLLAFALSACDRSGGAAAVVANPPPPYAYAIPGQVNDGWATGHLADNGFDADIVIDMMERIIDGTYPGIDAVAIARNETLVLASTLRTELDEYDGWIDNKMIDRHIMHSTSKSVTSALVGIAIDQGYIESVDVLFYSLFRYPQFENWDSRKAEMTLEDALTMRLGLEWDEWSAPYGSADNDLQILTSQNQDYAKALLDLPLISDPGTSFTYNTAATIAIGEALQVAVGVPMQDYAEVHLFRPLQIHLAEWATTPTELPNGGSGLFLRTRDMLKFGQLFISGGVWNGEQVISPQWTSGSVTRHVGLDWTYTSGYGYQWWLDRFTFNGTSIDSWSTRGFGGQYIFCVPALQLVVAFTGQNYGNSNTELPFVMMQDFILRSLEGP